MTKQIAIVGAGMGGMSAALDLVKAGHKVTIFENADIPGGLATGFKDPNWDWSVERFYHHWFASDKDMLGLINELGWSEDVLFPRPYTVMYDNGKFHPFDSIPAAILYPGLGWGIDKVRFGLVGLFLRLTGNWQALEKVTADSWMRKWAGERVYEKMWKPMLVGKFGEDYYNKVNMAWLWARLHGRTTRLGTFRGGFQAFNDRFAARLRELGVTIRFSTGVENITPLEGGKLRLTLNGGETADFDQCLVTTSPGQMARMAPALPAAYLEGLLALKHMGAVVMVLALKHAISREGYYWYNIPKSAGFPFLSLVEHTNFLPAEHFGGETIIYIGDYLNADHEFFSMDQEAVLQRFLPVLPRFNADFKPEWIRKTWMFRTAYAQPIPFVNHSQNIPATQTPLPGLYFASMSQVYPYDRGTNFAVEIARRTARQMMAG